MARVVKNTFVHIKEEGEDLARQTRRMKTEPAPRACKDEVWSDKDTSEGDTESPGTPVSPERYNEPETELPDTDDEGMIFGRTGTDPLPGRTPKNNKARSAEIEIEFSDTDDEATPMIFCRTRSDPPMSRPPMNTAARPFGREGSFNSANEPGLGFGRMPTEPLPDRARAAAPRFSAPPVMMVPQVPITQVHAISIPAGLPAGSTIYVTQVAGGGSIVQVGAVQGSGLTSPPSPASAPPTPMTPATPATPATTGSALPSRASSALLSPSSSATPQSQAPHEEMVEAEGPLGPHFTQERAPGVVARALGPDGNLRVRWTVDARKLKGSDRFVVSPAFSTSPVAPGSFRLMLCPASSQQKGGAMFKNSRGRGKVQLKCESSVDKDKVLTVAMSVPGASASAGPKKHDFGQAGVCDFEKSCNFVLAVDEAAKTFDVCLEMWV